MNLEVVYVYFLPGKKKIGIAFPFLIFSKLICYADSLESM